MMTTENSDTEFPKAYGHHHVEDKLYQFWQDKGYFTPTIDLFSSYSVFILVVLVCVIICVIDFSN